jgi:hypothetical protein
VSCIATDHRQAKRQAASYARQCPAGRVTERAGIPIRHLMHRDKSLFHNATQNFSPWTGPRHWQINCQSDEPTHPNSLNGTATQRTKPVDDESAVTRVALINVNDSAAIMS